MRIPVLLVMLACALGAQAHELWLEKSGKRWTLFHGHRHGGHEGERTLDYGANYVTATLCLDARAAPRPLAVLGTAPWSASGDCAALLVNVSSGYWSKTPWETRNVPKSEAPGALRSWLSKDSLKRVDRWHPAFARPFAEGLEILPTTDPFALKPGDKLVVRVVRAGQPVVGAPVSYHGDPRGETDPDGRVAIRLRHAGTQLISTSVELPLGDGRADTEILATALQFELPQ